MLTQPVFLLDSLIKVLFIKVLASLKQKD